MIKLIELFVLIVITYLAIETEFFNKLFQMPSYSTGFYAGDYVVPVLLILIFVSLQDK